MLRAFELTKIYTELLEQVDIWTAQAEGVARNRLIGLQHRLEQRLAYMRDVVDGEIESRR
jgi:hypothetical protein